MLKIHTINLQQKDIVLPADTKKINYLQVWEMGIAKCFEISCNNALHL